MRHLLATLVLVLLACEGATGLEEPTELKRGSFRAEVSGDTAVSLRGDAHNHFVKSAVTRKSLWLLRLGAPPGTDPDSARIELRLESPLDEQPEEGSYPIIPFTGDLAYSADSVWIGTDFDPGPLYFARSGSVTITEAIDNEVVAGRFEFTARTLADDSLAEESILVSGAFHAGAP